MTEARSKRRILPLIVIVNGLIFAEKWAIICNVPVRPL